MGKGYLSFSAAVVLQAVANGYLYGFDISDITGLPGGTVYAALRRHEEAGYLVSKWEKHTIAREAARPTRKYYELTRAGQDVLTEAVRRYRMLERNEPKREQAPKPSRA